MGGDAFRIFAAHRFSPDDFDLLTDDEAAILRGRRRNSPQQMADQLSMCVEGVYRRQRSIRKKLG